MGFIYAWVLGQWASYEPTASAFVARFGRVIAMYVVSLYTYATTSLGVDLPSALDTFYTTLASLVS